MIRTFCLVSCALLLPAPPAAGAPGPSSRLEVAVELDRREVTIGDPIGATITVRPEPGIRLEPIELGRTLGDFTLLEVGDPEEGAGEGEIRYRLTLALYRPGPHTLPPIRVRAHDPASGEGVIAESGPIEVLVVSVLPVGDEELADIRGPVPLPGGRAGWIVLPAALLAALLLYAWWRRRRRRPGAAPVAVAAPPAPAHEWARRQLRELERRDLLRRGAVEQFFVELAGILRGYLHRRFHIQTLERTTEELMESLRFARLPAGAVQGTRDLLTRCDLVKFARHQPDGRIGSDLLDLAGRLVEETRTREPEPAPAAGTAAGGTS